VLVQKIDDLFGPGSARKDAVGQVLPVDRSDTNGRFIKFELLDNVFLHFGCRSGREGMNAFVGEHIFERAKQAVILPEVMPPVTDAVRFINNEKGDRAFPEKLKGSFMTQSFRSNVEDFDLTGSDPGRHGLKLSPFQTGV